MNKPYLIVIIPASIVLISLLAFVIFLMMHRYSLAIYCLYALFPSGIFIYMLAAFSGKNKVNEITDINPRESKEKE